MSISKRSKAPQFLFVYLELFSFIGRGTKVDPGGDFSMYCWIEAADVTEALSWGHVLLGNYYKKRFAHSDDADLFDGTPIRKGEIETDTNTIDKLTVKYVIPQCQVGVFPEWKTPWKITNLERLG